jgi:hypothetical protein
MKRVTKELPCQLTEEEKRLRGRELASEVRKKLKLEDERKASAAEFKERKEEIDGTIVRLSNVVNSGIEPRQIECEERPNYHDRTVEIWRLDLEEQAGSRPMEPHELQAEIKLLKGEGEEKSSRRRH